MSAREIEADEIGTQTVRRIGGRVMQIKSETDGIVAGRRVSGEGGIEIMVGDRMNMIRGIEIVVEGIGMKGGMGRGAGVVIEVSTVLVLAFCVIELGKSLTACK